jgi:hypothetical protein
MNMPHRTRRAFSVHQPYAEQILRGAKKYEYHTIPTRIRGRVYIYATLNRKTGGPNSPTLLRGRVVGTVEVISCEWSGRAGCYRWRLSRPKRIHPRPPINHPQPVWFYPFAQKNQ